MEFANLENMIFIVYARIAVNNLSRKLFSSAENDFSLNETIKVYNKSVIPVHYNLDSSFNYI
jgi:hypothetical protein